MAGVRFYVERLVTFRNWRLWTLREHDNSYSALELASEFLWHWNWGIVIFSWKVNFGAKRSAYLFAKTNRRYIWTTFYRLLPWFSLLNTRFNLVKYIVLSQEINKVLYSKYFATWRWFEELSRRVRFSYQRLINGVFCVSLFVSTTHVYSTKPHCYWYSCSTIGLVL